MPSPKSSSEDISSSRAAINIECEFFRMFRRTGCQGDLQDILWGSFSRDLQFTSYRPDVIVEHIVILNSCDLDRTDQNGCRET